MFIAKKHISRRTVLRGMGGAVVGAVSGIDGTGADTLEKDGGRGEPHSSCLHGGCPRLCRKHEVRYRHNIWMPAKEGEDFEFTTILKPLEPFRDYMTVVSMMDCHAAGCILARKKSAPITSAPAPCS